MHSLVSTFISIIILPPGLRFMSQGFLLPKNTMSLIHIFTFRFETILFWQVQETAGLFQNGWIISKNSFIAWKLCITNALCSIKVVTNKLGFPWMGTFKSKKLNEQLLLKVHAQFPTSLALHAYDICCPCSVKKWTHLHQHLRKTGRWCSELVDIIQKIQF